MTLFDDAVSWLGRKSFRNLFTPFTSFLLEFIDLKLDIQWTFYMFCMLILVSQSLFTSSFNSFDHSWVLSSKISPFCYSFVTTVKENGDDDLSPFAVELLSVSFSVSWMMKGHDECLQDRKNCGNETEMNLLLSPFWSKWEEEWVKWLWVLRKLGKLVAGKG